MRQYRVVTNGINYRVQRLGKTFFLRRPKWYYLREYTYAGDYISVFATKQEAQKAIVVVKKEDAAKKQGYVPIEEDE